MPRQHLIGVKQQIQRFVEIDLVPAQQANAPGGANPLQRDLNGAGIDAIGAHALETQEDRAVGAMPAAGECQRAVELR